MAVKKAPTPGQFLPLSIVRMLFKRRKLIVFWTAILSVVGAAVVSRMPDVYRADALILVDGQKIPEKFVLSTVQVSLNDNVSAISQSVLSSGRLQKIIEDHNLYPKERQTKSQQELVAHFRRDLDITVERGVGGGRSGALRITYDGPTGAVVAAVVNRVADLFVQENFKTREERAQGTSEFLEAQLQQAKKSLEQQEAGLTQFKMQWAGELPEQQTALFSTLSRLQLELETNRDAVNRAQQNKVLLENTLRLAESSLDGAIRAAQPRVDVSRQDAAEQNLRLPVQNSSDVLRARLESLRSRYYDDHPEIRHVKAELARALIFEKRLQESRPAEKQSAASPAINIPPAATPQAIAEINRERERISTAKTQLGLLDQEVRQHALERERIVKEMANYENRLERLPMREQQMTALSRDYDNTKANYRSLLEKKLSAEMAADMEHQQQSERFTVADPARVPSKPVKPKRAIFYGAAVFGSLLLCAVCALALELRQNTFLGEWELQPNIQVLGRIGNLHNSPKQTMAVRLSQSASIWLLASAGVRLATVLKEAWF